jgi:hypothetical protein
VRNVVSAKLKPPFVTAELMGTGAPPIFSDAASQNLVNGGVKYTKSDGTFVTGTW